MCMYLTLYVYLWFVVHFAKFAEHTGKDKNIFEKKNQKKRSRPAAKKYK